MSLLIWAVARAAKLDKPRTGKVRVDRDLRAPMTPTGRSGLRLFGELFAERVQA